MASEPHTPGKGSTSSHRSSRSKELEVEGPQTFVKVHVGMGGGKKSFDIPKNIAVSQSPFFAAAFEGDFIEGETQELTLEDVDTDVFKLLLKWMYHNKPIELSRDKPDQETIARLANMWELAGRFLMPRLQNSIMDAFGSPDVPNNTHPLKVIMQTVYLNEYLGSDYDMESPLGRYCIRSQLFAARCFKVIERSMVHAPKVLSDRIEQQRRWDKLKDMLIGRGTSGGLIRSLLTLCDLQNMVIPDFNIRDYYVDENMEGI